MVEAQPIQLRSEEVRKTLKRVEVSHSHSELIAAELQKNIFGQEEATQAIARRVAMFESGLNEPTRPIGSVYELGGTGTGKTEMAHALANYWFDDPHSDRLMIINMSEYQEPHTTTKFVGSPPSYVGYGEKPTIPHDWLHAGRSIIVLDEFEKANPAIQKLMLGVLDKGTMTARRGSEGMGDLNFSNAFLIFTSNVGAKEISDVSDGKRQAIGFGVKEDQDKAGTIQNVAMREMQKTFSPEFIARLDEIIVFKPLERESYEKIYYKVIERRNELLKKHHGNKGAPFLATTEEFKNEVLNNLNGKGGRSLRQQLDRRLFDKFADVMNGYSVYARPFVADVENGETVFYTSDEIIEPEIEDESVIVEFPQKNISGKQHEDIA